MKECEHITIKLFLGCPINSELKMHLQASNSWKITQTNPSNENIKRLQFQDKEFLGRYLPKLKHSLSEIKALQHELLESIQYHCPELNINPLKIVIFPQVFIA